MSHVIALSTVINRGFWVYLSLTNKITVEFAGSVVDRPNRGERKLVPVARAFDGYWMRGTLQVNNKVTCLTSQTEPVTGIRTNIAAKGLEPTKWRGEKSEWVVVNFKFGSVLFQSAIEVETERTESTVVCEARAEDFTVITVDFGAILRTSVRWVGEERERMILV